MNATSKSVDVMRYGAPALAARSLSGPTGKLRGLSRGAVPLGGGAAFSFASADATSPQIGGRDHALTVDFLLRERGQSDQRTADGEHRSAGTVRADHEIRRDEMRGAPARRRAPSCASAAGASIRW